jgi:hypothetical protein
VTVGDWLSSREPALPAALADRLHASLAERMSDDAAHAYDALLDRAESLLGDLIAQGCAQRDRALELLAVDALVTYAFEAAADSPDTLAERATDAMSSIARLAVPAPAA